jgi:LysR family transcriptional regulator, glycine cleavage system transcriptional activator
MNTQRLIPKELVPVVAPTHALKKTKQLEGQTLLHSLARADDWDLWLKAAGLSRINAQRGMR